MVRKEECATVVVNTSDRETAIQQAYDDAHWTEIRSDETLISTPEVREHGT
jgi:hypothetical protein